MNIDGRKEERALDRRVGREDRLRPLCQLTHGPECGRELWGVGGMGVRGGIQTQPGRHAFVLKEGEASIAKTVVPRGLR